MRFIRRYIWRDERLHCSLDFSRKTAPGLDDFNYGLHVICGYVRRGGYGDFSIRTVVRTVGFQQFGNALAYNGITTSGFPAVAQKVVGSNPIFRPIYPPQPQGVAVFC